MTSRKLTRPTVPHAAVTEQLIRKLRAMSVSEVRATFVKSGILRPDGTLAPPYDGTEPAPDERTS